MKVKFVRKKNVRLREKLKFVSHEIYVNDQNAPTHITQSLTLQKTLPTLSLIPSHLTFKILHPSLATLTLHSAGDGTGDDGVGISGDGGDPSSSVVSGESELEGSF